VLPVWPLACASDRALSAAYEPPSREPVSLSLSLVFVRASPPPKGHFMVVSVMGVTRFGLGSRPNPKQKR